MLRMRYEDYRTRRKKWGTRLGLGSGASKGCVPGHHILASLSEAGGNDPYREQPLSPHSPSDPDRVGREPMRAGARVLPQKSSRVQAAASRNFNNLTRFLRAPQHNRINWGKRRTAS